jgi:predicted nucleotidyltransferase component of viral defense system
MINPAYRAQVDLLLRVLPFVAEEQVFALKGGTAINRAGNDAKLSCQFEQTKILIEVNTTMRGHLFEPSIMGVVDKVQAEFEWFAEINVVSKGELFGGKICAALDRQHPRDLFDIHYLFENEGLTDEIRMGFIAGILSHPRPINEMLNPNFIDQNEAFERQFSGMSLEPFSYEDFMATRIRLIDQIKRSLTNNDKNFLLSFKKGEPKWELFDALKLKDMPAIKWKLLNIRKLMETNAQKHTESLKVLEKEIVAL